MVYKWWQCFPCESSFVGIYILNTQKGSTSSSNKHKQSDLTLKINIQKNLSVHTSERICNTFTQKNNYNNNKGFVHICS